MVKGQKKLKLGRKGSHKRALVRNLLRSLFSNGYLTTTTIKAKALRQEALKLITDLKGGDFGTIKYASVTLGSRDVVEKAMKYLSENTPAVKVLKMGYRSGDNAQTSRVTLVGFNTKKEKVFAEKKESKKEDKKVETVKPKNVMKEQRVGKKVAVVNKGKTERSRSRSGL